MEEGTARDGILADVVGGPTVLVVYKGNNTGACDRQLASVIAASDEIGDLAYRLVGLSKNGAESHLRYADKMGIDFPLVSDPRHVVSAAVGALVTRRRAGRTSIGPQRATYVLDGAGLLLRVLDDVDTTSHGRQIIRALRAIDEAADAGVISIETTLAARLADAWAAWVTPHDICAWNAASDAWSTPRAEVDLRVGGRFCFRMEARDGSAGFDFAGVYTEVRRHERLASRLDDGRSVLVTFSEDSAGGTLVRQSFEPDSSLSRDQQRAGWMSILERFCRHVDAKRA
ncbi:MAG: redoxin domain-containing protein [Bacteroidota bacterium]